MPEMPVSCKDQGNTFFIGRLNDLLVANRSARLDDGNNSGIGKYIEPIAEREERIAGRYGSTRLLPRLLNSNTRRIHPVRLTAASALSFAIRIALLFTDFTARHANSSSSICSGVG